MGTIDLRFLTSRKTFEPKKLLQNTTRESLKESFLETATCLASHRLLMEWTITPNWTLKFYCTVSFTLAAIYSLGYSKLQITQEFLFRVCLTKEIWSWHRKKKFALREHAFKWFLIHFIASWLKIFALLFHWRWQTFSAESYLRFISKKYDFVKKNIQLLSFIIADQS